MDKSLRPRAKLRGETGSRVQALENTVDAKLAAVGTVANITGLKFNGAKRLSIFSTN
jgi:hypothetical protein